MHAHPHSHRRPRAWRRLVVGGAAVALLVSAVAAATFANAAEQESAGDTATPAAAKEFPANLPWDYQIGGVRDRSGVKVVSRDATDPIAAGLFNICYVNGFQTQPDSAAGKDPESTSAAFTSDATRKPLLLKNPTPDTPTAKNDKYATEFYVDPGWPGEIMFDLTKSANLQPLAEIVGKRIQLCKEKGYDAVEVDNLDTFTRAFADKADRIAARDNPDFDGSAKRKIMTQAQALAYAKLLIDKAHGLGMLIGQKNTLDLGSAGKNAGFDFAVIEQCGAFEECGDFAEVYGSDMVVVEYTAEGFTNACTTVGSQVSVVLRDEAVTPSGPYREC